MAGKAKAEPKTQTSQTSPYPGVSKAKTALCRNQGFPQPAAPKSASVSRTGNRSHRIGAIQKLATAMPYSKRKGDTTRYQSGDNRGRIPPNHEAVPP